jgi:hypothetical protein
MEHRKTFFLSKVLYKQIELKLKKQLPHEFGKYLDFLK